MKCSVGREAGEAMQKKVNGWLGDLPAKLKQHFDAHDGGLNCATMQNCCADDATFCDVC